MEEVKADFNEWWLSLSDGQREAWQDDKWMLASIAFRAGYMKGLDRTDTR